MWYIKKSWSTSEIVFYVKQSQERVVHGVTKIASIWETADVCAEKSISELQIYKTFGQGTIPQNRTQVLGEM